MPAGIEAAAAIPRNCLRVITESFGVTCRSPAWKSFGGRTRPSVVPSPAPGGTYASTLNVRTRLGLGLLLSLSTAAPLGIHARGLIGGFGRLLLLLGALPGISRPTTTDGSALPTPTLSLCRTRTLRVYRVVGHLG